ncbi:MAG: hypothetical protein CXT75_05340 [Methanobacteriota archaeon]|nr:MAG: hypothetical protein CXT75_05340 [Euryarchaeota archaeon]
MSLDDELWNSGANSEITEEDADEDEALDLSSPSPEINDDLNLNNNEITEADDWAVPVLENNEVINIRAIGAIGVTAILLLTGTLFFLFVDADIIVNVPYEKYGEQITYDIEGVVNFESTLDIPLPLGFIDNDIIINQLNINFSGKLQTGINAPTSIIDGYGNEQDGFGKYLIQDLEDIDGKITREGDFSSNRIENAEARTSQKQFVDPTSLEIIRSDIESNASYSDIFGETWYLQRATDWIPRNIEPGLLPHGDAYIGKTLTEGTEGIIIESGIEYNWKVDNGGKIDNEQTVLLTISSSLISEFAGYKGHYEYKFEFYMTETSSMPFKFKMSLNSDLSSIVETMYKINIEYQGLISKKIKGHTEIPTTSYKSNSNVKTGEFSPWIEGAPAFGGGNCGLNSSFNLQTGIEKGTNEINGFNQYITNQKNLDERPGSKINESAFVIEAKYPESNGTWNFTMAHYSEQDQTVKGWNLLYNANITGKEMNVNNPIMTMEDVSDPLTVCSAEEVMTNFEEIGNWAIDSKTGNVNYNKVELSLGQNLVSKQSLVSPTSIFDLGGGLNFANIMNDVRQGNLELNLDYYTSNIDVNAAGSYAYFLEKKGVGVDSSENEYEYRKLAGVDAKDGLVLFNLESINTT